MQSQKPTQNVRPPNLLLPGWGLGLRECKAFGSIEGLRLYGWVQGFYGFSVFCEGIFKNWGYPIYTPHGILSLKGAPRKGYPYFRKPSYEVGFLSLEKDSHHIRKYKQEPYVHSPNQ